MSRTRYIIAYDISDDRRRTKVFEHLKGIGDHAQFSVFFCDLTALELARARRALSDIVHHRDDQLLIVRLGPASTALDLSLECIGRAYCPSTRTLIV